MPSISFIAAVGLEGLPLSGGFLNSSGFLMASEAGSVKPTLTGWVPLVWSVVFRWRWQSRHIWSRSLAMRSSGFILASSAAGRTG
ncbi:MAG TPA: hypothetical protein DER40_08075 [Geobacter sp.]|nr:hypothetical protein [Geobacter sp.]